MYKSYIAVIIFKKPFPFKFFSFYIGNKLKLLNLKNTGINKTVRDLYIKFNMLHY